MPASSDDRKSARPVDATAGIAVVWLAFYALILASALGTGKPPRISKAYARIDTQRQATGGVGLIAKQSYGAATVRAATPE